MYFVHAWLALPKYEVTFIAMILLPPLKAKKLNPLAKLPQRANPTDAGLDIFSVEEVTLFPVGNLDGASMAELPTRAAIKTGIALAVPEGYGLFIWPRSGLAVKHGLDRLAGVVDASYRGELQIVLTNLGNEPYTIKVGDKIAQGILAPIALSNVEEVDELDSTTRGEGGFGSTGR